jgi:Caspase domain
VTADAAIDAAFDDAMTRTLVAMIRFLLLLGLAFLWVTDTCAAAERRVALVVGAAKYAHAHALAHTLDDARDVAAALKRLGFDVDLVLDPDRAVLEGAVRRLGQKSRGADASLFYYSGHALEAQGVNWVLPVSAEIQSDRDLRFEALDLSAVLEQVEGLARVSLVFLDACREDPFKQRLTTTRDLPRSGLASMNANAAGTYVAFATAPGMVAADGAGPHSPFTSALLKYVETPGLEVNQMMSKVRADVEEATDNTQIPWDSSSLKGDFYFNPANADKVSEAVAQAINGPNPQVDLDALFWESVDRSKPADLNAYLVKFPQGTFAELARNRLAELKATPVAPALPPPDPKLIDALAGLVPTATSQWLKDNASRYQALQQHKALVVYLSTGQAWWPSSRPSAQEAEDRAFESCELFAGTPCALVAVDDDIRFAKGSPVVQRTMPRVHYVGRFDPERIPAMPQAVLQRPDVAGYLAAPTYKAAAIHPNPRLFIVTGATSQRAAEEQALAVCNDDPTRKGANGPCYLYASGDDVVLPRRSRTPITGAQVVAQPEPVKPVTPPAPPLNQKLVDALAGLLPSSGKSFWEDTATKYQAGRQHKALVVYAAAGKAMWNPAKVSEQVAEESVRERCEIFAGTPCVLVAIDDDVKYAPGTPIPQQPTMPKVHYVGRFDRAQLPATSEAVRERPDVVGYLSAPTYKAAAIHPDEKLFVVTGAASQRAAEEQALANCNGDPGRNGQNGPCYLYASGDDVVLSRRSATPVSGDAPSFHDALIAQVQRSLPALAAADREAMVKAFEGGQLHRALALHSKDGGTYRFFSWPSAEAAEEATLEGCQAFYGEPCALLAVDDMASVPALRDMPRIHYAGPFNPAQIPAVTAAIRGQADIVSYLSKPSPKAVGYHPWGQVYVVSEAKNQNEAETKALAACNSAPARNGKGGPCYLYASGNQVVLDKRLRSPLTPAIASTPTVPPPAPTPGSPGDAALIEALFDRLSARLQADARQKYDYAVRNYVTFPVAGPSAHRAFAAGLKPGGNAGIGLAFGESTPESATALALERCQLQVVDPCALIAFDRNAAPADGKWTPRDMGRLHYAGAFDVNQIPGLAVSDRARVGSYSFAPSPKAAVLDQLGRIYAVEGAKSQLEAETKAFAMCGGTSCYLYAAANRVILPQRLQQARPVGDSLAAVLSYLYLSDPAGRADAFNKDKQHRTLVVFPELPYPWVFEQYPSAQEAERLALEFCGLKFNTACVVVATDDRLVNKDPWGAPRNRMPRLTYQGNYRPDMVPLYATPPKAATDYPHMRGPKAMAIRPDGRPGPTLVAETGATAAEAQSKALAKCNDPDLPYPCFLYAVNDAVILPQRRTEPMP